MKTLKVMLYAVVTIFLTAKTQLIDFMNIGRIKDFAELRKALKFF